MLITVLGSVYSYLYRILKFLDLDIVRRMKNDTRMGVGNVTTAMFNMKLYR